MKKLLILLLVAVALLAFAACSEEQDQTPQTTAAAAGMTTEDVGDPQEIEEGPGDWDLADMCVGQEVQALFDNIGLPQKMEYYDSPMDEEGLGQIQEGVLYYPEFMVLTIKEGDYETVSYVEAYPAEVETTESEG